jgi:hypothetical protein
MADISENVIQLKTGKLCEFMKLKPIAFIFRHLPDSVFLWFLRRGMQIKVGSGKWSRISLPMTVE